MRSRHLILGLILLTLLVTVLAASAKLRGAPKYDRIQVGMTSEQVQQILGKPDDWLFYMPLIGPCIYEGRWESAEGTIMVQFADSDPALSVTEKRIARRGPMERLAWLAGWR